MSPTLSKARRIHAMCEMGRMAEGVEWWRPGLPLADGVRIFDQVVPPPPPQLSIFDQIKRDLTRRMWDTEIEAFVGWEAAA